MKMSSVAMVGIWQIVPSFSIIELSLQVSVYIGLGVEKKEKHGPKLWNTRIMALKIVSSGTILWDARVQWYTYSFPTSQVISFSVNILNFLFAFTERIVVLSRGLIS